MKSETKKVNRKENGMRVQVKQLILLWEKEEVHYNSKHEKYYSKDKQQKALKQISPKLITQGFSKIGEA